jgi:hypothetical protein
VNATRQIQLLTGQLVSLQDALSQLQGTDTAPGSVLSPATLPGKASGIGPQIIVGVGGVLGLLAGLVFAIALTRSDKRVRRSAVMVEDVPVLSVLGARRRLLAGRSSDHPQRGLRSSYQRLRIGALAAVPPSSSIALSALAEHEEVGDVAAELGSSFTRAGYHVVVVLATAETTAMSVLDVADEPGLSDVLAGAANAADVLLDRGGLQVLAPGRDIEEVQERLSGDRSDRPATAFQRPGRSRGRPLQPVGLVGRAGSGLSRRPRRRCRPARGRGRLRRSGRRGAGVPWRPGHSGSAGPVRAGPGCRGHRRVRPDAVDGRRGRAARDRGRQGARGRAG